MLLLRSTLLGKLVETKYLVDTSFIVMSSQTRRIMVYRHAGDLPHVDVP